MGDDRWEKDSTVYANAAGTTLRDAHDDEELTTLEWFLKKMRAPFLNDDEKRHLKFAKLIYKQAYLDAAEIYRKEKETSCNSQIDPSQKPQDTSSNSKTESPSSECSEATPFASSNTS